MEVAELGERAGPRNPEGMPPAPPPIPGFLVKLSARGRDFIVFGDEGGRWARALLFLGAASVEAWDPGLRGLEPFRHPSLRWRPFSVSRAQPDDIVLRDVVCLGPPLEIELACSLVRAAEHALVASPAERAEEWAAMGFHSLGALDDRGSWLVFAKGMRDPERALPATSIEPAP